MSKKTITGLVGLIIVFTLMFTATLVVIHNLTIEIQAEKDKSAAWERSYRRLDGEATNRYSEYEDAISKFKEQIDEQRESVVNLTKQIDTLKKDNTDLRLQVDEYKKKEEEEKKKAEEAVIVYEEPQAYNIPTSGLTPTGGVNDYNGQLETYYNLPMEKVIEQAQNWGIEGEYWIREDGVKMYGDYIMLACNRDVHPMGSLVETSLGTGISLDTGAFADVNPTQVDIAVDWAR